jgi:hypothetical protein
VGCRSLRGEETGVGGGLKDGKYVPGFGMLLQPFGSWQTGSLYSGSEQSVHFIGAWRDGVMKDRRSRGVRRRCRIVAKREQGFYCRRILYLGDRKDTWEVPGGFA